VSFYGPEQARIHDERFGDLAADAARLVLDRLRAAGLTAGRVTDLGCGSGILVGRMLDAGYEVTGVDLSAAMVDLARAAVTDGDFRVASALDAQLRRSVALTATGEVLQYATDPRAGLDALAAVAGRVFAALEAGGVFVLDLSTPGRNLGLDVRHVFHDHDGWMLGMHAVETPATGGEPARLDRRIVILVREDDGRYRRVDEHHVLVLFDREDVVRVLEDAGFAVETRAAYTEATASTPAAGWAVFVATRP
jgi:SAM-dependent methyltransferase